MKKLKFKFSTNACAEQIRRMLCNVKTAACHLASYACNPDSALRHSEEVGWGFYPNNNVEAQISLQDPQREAYKKGHSDLLLRNSEAKPAPYRRPFSTVRTSPRKAGMNRQCPKNLKRHSDLSLRHSEAKPKNRHSYQVIHYEAHKKAAFSLAEAMSGFSKYAKSCCARVMIKSSNCLKQLRNEMKTTRALNNPRPAFSLAEAMITLLMVSIILAAIAPIMSKRMRLTQTGFSSMRGSGGGSGMSVTYDTPGNHEFKAPAGVDEVTVTVVGGGGGGGAANAGSKLLTATESNWTVPTGVTKLRVYMIGAGGSGASGGAGVGEEYGIIPAGGYAQWTTPGEYTLDDLFTGATISFTKPTLPAACVNAGSKWELNASSAQPQAVNITACGGGGGGGSGYFHSLVGGGASGGGVLNISITFKKPLFIRVGGGGGTGLVGAGYSPQGPHLPYNNVAPESGTVCRGGRVGGYDNASPGCTVSPIIAGASGGMGGTAQTSSNWNQSGASGSPYGTGGGGGGSWWYGGGGSGGGATIILSEGLDLRVSGGGGGGSGEYGTWGTGGSGANGGNGGSYSNECNCGGSGGGGGGGGRRDYGANGGSASGGVLAGFPFPSSNCRGGGTKQVGGDGATRITWTAATKALKCTYNMPANGAGGGGAGQVWIGELSVTPNQKLNFNVGTGGGSVTNPGTNGNNGNDTTITGNASATAKGGYGGKYSSTTDPAVMATTGGVVASGQAAIVKQKDWLGLAMTNPTSGEQGYLTNHASKPYYGGTGGRSLVFEPATKTLKVIQGGQGGSSQVSGISATAVQYGIGGGGGGGVKTSGSTPGKGGAGGNGLIYIEWGGNTGGGGSSGMVIDEETVPVQYGQTIDVKVGAGGLGGTVQTNSTYTGGSGLKGSDGQESSFGNLKALGGGGGFPGGLEAKTPGKGGTISSLPTGGLYTKGSDGTSNDNGTPFRGGNGGLAPYSLAKDLASGEGLGGCGGFMPNSDCGNHANNATGKDGRVAGGGGGGGAVSDNMPEAGGKGADGAVIVQW